MSHHNASDVIPVGDDFLSTFIASFSVIIVSEIGDKTFWLAAIMAMKHPRWEVFGSAIVALALMTVLSATVGTVLPSLLTPLWTHRISIVVFFGFGIRLLVSAWFTEATSVNVELKEAEEEIQRADSTTIMSPMAVATPKASTSRNGNNKVNGSNGEPIMKYVDQSTRAKLRRFLRRFFSPFFLQCFSMTFLAEWGDRSQMATIALAAARGPVVVSLGCTLGHCFCTGFAVISGKYAASSISERSIAAFGGVCYILCGIYSVYSGPHDTHAHSHTNVLR